MALERPFASGSMQIVPSPLDRLTPSLLLAQLHCGTTGALRSLEDDVEASPTSNALPNCCRLPADGDGAA